MPRHSKRSRSLAPNVIRVRVSKRTGQTPDYFGAGYRASLERGAEVRENQRLAGAECLRIAEQHQRKRRRADTFNQPRKPKPHTKVETDVSIQKPAQLYSEGQTQLTVYAGAERLGKRAGRGKASGQP